jgi:tetratricopeptide (TPR) repeat protein
VTSNRSAAPTPDEERAAVASRLDEADRLRQDGRHEEAVRILVGLLERGSEQRATVFYRLGNVYIDAGDLARAEGAYKRAIEIDPYHANALNNLAVVYKRQGRTGLFVRTYRRAMRAPIRGGGGRKRRGGTAERPWWRRRDVMLIVILCAVAVVVLVVLRSAVA